MGWRGIGIIEWFSRIFFRNAINNGLLVFKLQEGIETMRKGDTLSIDFENGIVTHEGNEYHFPALSVGSLATLEEGG